MEGELIIVSIITTLGGLFGLWMLNQNWFKRQDAKYKYKLKTARMRHKYKSSEEKEPPSTLSTVSNLLPLLKDLDSDQIGALIDTFAGGVEPTEAGGLEELLGNIPPETIAKFLEGLNAKKGKTEQDEGFTGM